jgi:UDP-N-acetylglucosamine diphosphorylase/glucosamine-1-phosphate N-acetyltransferase
VTSLAPNGSLFLYDDARARAFEPFATSRPISETRCGALLVRERWQQVLGTGAAAFISSEWLQHFGELESPPALTSSTIPAGCWVVNSRALPHLGLDVRLTERFQVLTIDGKVAAVRLDAPIDAADLRDGQTALDTLAGDAVERCVIGGLWLEEVWDMIATLTPLLNDDIPRLARDLHAIPLTAAHSPHVAVMGNHPVWVEPGATVEAFVSFDTHAGPVLLRRGSQVQSFTRVVGPCYVGEQSTVMADRIANCSIGPTCRAHGELSSSIFIGHANKGHDGFVGHSVLGRWVNLGAGTITSNLKNTYGAVSLWTPTGTRWTGQQFLGTLFGDHVKTGIGLRLTTGCVLGAGANVYDSMPPKHVRPFSWGSGPASYTEFDADRFVTMAERMMQRRHVQVDDSMRAYFRAVHAHGRSDATWERA